MKIIGSLLIVLFLASCASHQVWLYPGTQMTANQKQMNCEYMANMMVKGGSASWYSSYEGNFEHCMELSGFVKQK